MIHAIVVDDEPLAAQLLSNKLQAFEGMEVIKTFSNPLLLLEELQQLSFNTAFLDIEMPGINGIDLAEHILSVNPSIHIVFVTAYRDYAVQAFELNSIDYLLKPLADDRLKITVGRIHEQLRVKPSKANDLSAPLLITSFSEFAVHFNKEPVKWKTAKVKELFAFLMMNHQKSINRDILIDTLWPDTDYSKAKVQLHTALSHLRKTLETIGQPKVITFANQGYCLELCNFQYDVLNIEKLLADHTAVTSSTIELFEQAAGHYTGNYLEQEAYEWAYVQATILHQSMFQLLNKMIDYYESIGDLNNREKNIQRLVQLDPYSEQAQQSLLAHYIETGNRTEAITVFQDFKRRLLDEMGILPSKSTNALYNQILFSEQL